MASTWCTDHYMASTPGRPATTLLPKAKLVAIAVLYHAASMPMCPTKFPARVCANFLMIFYPLFFELQSLKQM